MVPKKPKVALYSRNTLVRAKNQKGALWTVDFSLYLQTFCKNSGLVRESNSRIPASQTQLPGLEIPRVNP